LKRESGDFNTFTEKATPVIDDIVLIEDSEDTFSKKKVKLANMLGGGGEGGINYVENSNFESDAVGHTAYKNTAGEVPTTGTGGTPTIVISRSTTDPLVGDASGLVEKGALDTQGEGINVTLKDFDNADKARIQIISFEYDASDANYVDGDYRVYFLDNTNSKVIRVNGEDIKGGKGTHYARIQVPIDCDNGSMLIHCATTNANAIDFKYDRVSMAPQIINTGAFVTDWEEYTPIIGGLGAVTGLDFYSCRVGESLKVRGTLTSGTPVASDVEIGLPSGLNISSNSLPTGVNNVGTFTLDASSTQNGGIVLGSRGDSFVNVSPPVIRGAIATYNAFQVAAGNGVFPPSTTASFEFSVPIQGWSANTQTSEDFGGRDVIVEAAGNSGQTITGGSPLVFNSVEDSTASWDGSTLTVPESGIYIYTGVLDPTSLPGTVAILESINGVSGKSSTYRQAPNANDVLQFTGIVKLSKGDTFFLFCSDTLTLSTNPTYSHLHIQKLASSQQILETERVAARYTSDSGQTIGTSTTTLIYENLELDDSAIYNPTTGIGKIKVSGVYSFSASYFTDTVFLSGNSFQQIQIYVNGVDVVAEFIRGNDSTIGRQVSVSISSIYLEKDDLFSIRGVGSVSVAMGTSTVYNNFSIARIK
jgi:hypothetical protein